jgi:hypothetical protein
MIDTATALKQQCYILFDTTEQLKQFVIDNKIHPFMGVNDGENILYCPESEHGEYVPTDQFLYDDIQIFKHSQLK